MLTDTILFYIFAVLVLGGGILTITRRSAVHSAMSLIVSLLGVAGFYLLQKAEFLFAVQIVLYIGGIMVLFLFVIVLVDQAAEGSGSSTRQWLAGLVAAGLAGAQIGWFAIKGKGAFAIATPAMPSASAGSGNTEQIAEVLFSEYLLPFEIASILLLVAVVGSVIVLCMLCDRSLHDDETSPRFHGITSNVRQRTVFCGSVQGRMGSR